MPTSSKKKKTSKKNAPKSRWAFLLKPFKWIHRRTTAYLDKRPHRSFRRTKRRDALRPLELPNVFAFTKYVNGMLRKHWRTFLLLGIVYAGLYSALVGLASQQTYTELTDTLQETGSKVFQGDWGEIGKAGLLFVTVATAGISEEPSDVQQLFSVLLVMLVWLTTVWMFRSILANRKAKLRDGLYNAGAPIVATFILGLVLLIQLIPVAFAFLGYVAAETTGLINGGVEAMAFWFAAGLLGLLSLYWITSTFFAFVIVTIPGMYPLKALSVAGDMVLGRRLKIMLRWIWMIFVVLLTWALILIPVILIDGWLKDLWVEITWLPIIPFFVIVLATWTTIWSSSYIYLLYRKVVDEDARHA